jgi:transcriptional regulator with XRE-family HTH domain
MKRPRNGMAMVRHATRLSQQQFAAHLGISKATVENIELNRAPLTPELQEAIGVLTGVVPETLVSGSGKPRPLDFNQKSYSRESWQAWRQTEIRYEDTEMLHEMSVDYLNVLLKAAYETSDGRQTPHTFRSVLMNFNRFIFREIKRQNLADRINRLFATYIAPPPEFGETTVRWCRSEFGDHPEWEKHIRPGWKDLDKVKFKSQFSPDYVPFIGFANIGGGPAFFSGLRSGLTIFDLEIGDQKFRVAKRKVSFKGFLGSNSKLGEKPPPFRRRKQKA